jgi:hypothetical protein
VKTNSPLCEDEIDFYEDGRVFECQRPIEGLEATGRKHPGRHAHTKPDGSILTWSA